MPDEFDQFIIVGFNYKIITRFILLLKVCELLSVQSGYLIDQGSGKTVFDHRIPVIAFNYFLKQAGISPFFA